MIVLGACGSATELWNSYGTPAAASRAASAAPRPPFTAVASSQHRDRRAAASGLEREPRPLARVEVYVVPGARPGTDPAAAFMNLYFGETTHGFYCQAPCPSS